MRSWARLLRKESHHIRTLGWWTGIKDKLELFPDGIDLDLLGNLLDNEPLEAFRASFSSPSLVLSDRMLTRAIDALADPQPLPAWIDRKLLMNKLEVWLHTEGSVCAPPSPPPDDDGPKKQPIKITLQLEPVPIRVWNRKNQLEATRTFIQCFKNVRQRMGIPPDEIRIEYLDTDIWVILAKSMFREDLNEILKRVGEQRPLSVKQIEEGPRKRLSVFNVKFTPPQGNLVSRRAQSESFQEIMIDCCNDMNLSPDAIRFSIDQVTALPVITLSHNEHRDKLNKMLIDAESELSVGISLIRVRK